jgi:hypothetical protein
MGGEVMPRFFVLTVAALLLGFGGLTFVVAQDATPETNVLGTPCPSPTAGTPEVGTPEVGTPAFDGTPELGTPAIDGTPELEGTPVIVAGCPEVEAATPIT